MSCAFPFLILRGGKDLSCVAALSWLFKDEPTKMFTMTITMTGANTVLLVLSWIMTDGIRTLSPPLEPRHPPGIYTSRRTS